MLGVSFIGKLPQCGSPIKDFHTTSRINFDSMPSGESRQTPIIVSLEIIVQWGIHPSVSIPDSGWWSSFENSGKFVFDLFEDQPKLLQCHIDRKKWWSRGQSSIKLRLSLAGLRGSATSLTVGS